MGISINALKFLATAASSGCDLQRTVMIGRQRLYVTPDEIERALAGRGASGAPPSDPEYAEGVLRRLGAEVTDSIDVSDYEGATILHDLNLPLPAEFHQRYTTVLECGTIEHIFNFPIAIRNCMDLLAVGGRLVCCTVTNNFCGHGFYQFSPELFYRILRPENGFEIERMVVCDAFYESRWFAVTDPDVLQRRVELVGPYPVMLLVQARKVAAVAPFQQPPQQSDYVPAWSGRTHADHAPPARQRFSFRSLIPPAVMHRVRAYRSARQYQLAGMREVDPG
jgi:hypothetical protein